MRQRKGNYNRFQRKSNHSVGLSFIAKYWLLIILAVVGIPLGYRYWQNQKAKNEANKLSNFEYSNNVQNNSASPTIQEAKARVVHKKYPNLSDKKLRELNTNAQKLTYALGTNVEDNHRNSYIDLFNVAAWTENEALAVSLVKKHTGTFPILADLYYNVYTKSRNLKTDLLKYLSKSDLAEIRKAHLANGGFKHI